MYAAATLLLSSSRTAGRAHAWRSTVVPFGRGGNVAFVSSMGGSRGTRQSSSWSSLALVAQNHRRRYTVPLSRCFASTGDSEVPPQPPLTTSDNDDDQNQQSKDVKKKKKTPSNTKFKINEKLSTLQATRNLERVFDELAKKEGFTRKGTKDGKFQTFYADDATFEDDFILGDDNDNDGGDDDDEEGEYLDDFADIGIFDDADSDSVTQEDDDDGGVVTYPDPVIRAHRMQLPSNDDDDDEGDDDMEARLAAAQRDLDTGRITADNLVEDISREDMRRLGFRYEENPFDNQKPEKPAYQLVTNALTCSACGADFQAKNETRPGYLPPEKYEYQLKLGKLEELQRVKERADSVEWSPEDEIEWLLETTTMDHKDGSGGVFNKEQPATMADSIDLELEAEKFGLDWNELQFSSKTAKKVICKRCHGLQYFGKVDDALRPGWTDEPLMSQEKFRDLLRPLSSKPAVIIAIVDLFDFSGSVLPELDAIAGPDNPVIIAANKADLLPDEMGATRVESWVRRELDYMGIQSLANVGGAVRLVSCKTGLGVDPLLAKARKLADEMDCDVYIVGAANAGKSTLMNYVLRGQNKEDNPKDRRKRRAGNTNAFKGALTTSPLPGTTLKFIKIDLGGGRSLYDTPGLLVPGTITQLLTSEELKIVVPTSKVEPITFRLASGKCVLVGGMARISVIGDSKPFLFTFYVANRIKLHVTDVSRADDFVQNHSGGMLTPPLEPGPERMKQMGEFERHVVAIEGAGWKEAAADITLTGLGWVAVTGAGTAHIEISVPKGIGVQVRPPLMPFDVWETTAKYTGGRAVRKSSKSKSGKRRKGVGRN